MKRRATRVTARAKKNGHSHYVKHDYDCDDCGEMSPDKYGPMLLDTVWSDVSDYKAQFLCSDCVERRLDRPIIASDLRYCGLSGIWWETHRPGDLSFRWP